MAGKYSLTGECSSGRPLRLVNSHFAPIFFDGTSLPSMKSKVLYLARKAKKNNVALSHIFLVCTDLYG